MNSKLYILLFLFFFSFSVFAKGDKIAFETKEIDLGTMSVKDSRKCVFRYTNRDISPMIFFDMQTSCGCTKTKFSKKPLAANGRDSIIVTFHPDTSGAFYKTIKTKDNKRENHVLVIRGMVSEK